MRDAKILTAMSALALLAGTASAGSNFKVADSYEDFQGSQGENGWFYGFYNGSGPNPYTPDDFQLMTDWDPDNNRWWVDNSPGSTLTLVDAVYMHPFIMTNGEGTVSEEWAVRRWVSTMDGPVSIQIDAVLAEVTTAPIADGVRVHVFVDGVKRAVSTVNPQNPGSMQLELFETVAQGSVIDFAIDPVGNSFFDAVEFSAVIMSTVPSPASLALLGFGALAFSGRRR